MKITSKRLNADLASLNPQPLPPKEGAASPRAGFSAVRTNGVALSQDQFVPPSRRGPPAVDQKKAELRGKAKDSQDELEALKAELEALNDRSSFESFLDGLFGGDGGAGEVGDAKESGPAELDLSRQAALDWPPR